MDTQQIDIQQTFLPPVGKVREVIVVEDVHHGQPRPYADHLDVVRVHFIGHNPYAQDTPKVFPNGPERFQPSPEYLETVYPDPEKRAEHTGRLTRVADQHAHEQIRKALRIAGMDHLADENNQPLRSYGDFQSPSWLVSAKFIGPGVVEIRSQTLFFD